MACYLGSKDLYKKCILYDDIMANTEKETIELFETIGQIFLWNWLAHLPQNWVLSQAETIITILWSFGRTEQIYNYFWFKMTIFHPGSFWVTIVVVLWICLVWTKGLHRSDCCLSLIQDSNLNQVSQTLSFYSVE